MGHAFKALSLITVSSIWASVSLAQDGGPPLDLSKILPGGIGAGIVGVELPAKSQNEKRDNALLVQQSLAQLGFYLGNVDGIFGKQSKAAISKFQEFLGEETTGTLTKRQQDYLVEFGVLLQGESPPPGRLFVHVVPASQTLANATNSTPVRASRIFSGPEDFPPREFAAYGILAFPARASSHDRDRHLMICEAYVNSIRSHKKLGLPTKMQMATVWPVDTGEEAAKLMGTDLAASICPSAVVHYNDLMAENALKDAALAGASVSGIGPYLLAWAPAFKKGEPDAMVLVADLSSVQDYNTALGYMRDWVQEIERDPSLWANGWSMEKLRLVLQRWFDRRGTQLLEVASKM